jgi:hypothetical protein
MTTQCMIVTHIFARSFSTSGASITHAEMDMDSSTNAYIKRVDVELVHVVLAVEEVRVCV